MTSPATSSNLTVLSLFAGAGGLDLGFSAAGFRTVGHVELEQWACDTLRANHPEAVVIGPPDHSGDVREVSARLLRELRSELAEVDVIIGGPPCQPYSVAAAQRFLRGDDRFKRTGHADARRGGLFLEFYRLVAEVQPRAFLLENVPGLLELDGGEAISAMVQDLEELGYNVARPTILQAADFGVPQFRQRAFVMGAKDSLPSLPVGKHGAEGTLLQPRRGVAHALAGMPQDLPNHVPRNHAPASVARYRTLAFGQREQLGRVDRLDPLRPSKTVIAGGSNGGGRSHLHPYIARTLTVRECARLQTFPDDYVFSGSSARQFTQVGNAVPPLLGEHLARALRQALGAPCDEAPTSGPYLERSAPVEALAEQLLSESRQQRPDWLYHDTVSLLAAA